MWEKSIFRFVIERVLIRFAEWIPFYGSMVLARIRRLSNLNFPRNSFVTYTCRESVRESPQVVHVAYRSSDKAMSIILQEATVRRSSPAAITGNIRWAGFIPA